MGHYLGDRYHVCPFLAEAQIFAPIRQRRRWMGAARLLGCGDPSRLHDTTRSRDCGDGHAIAMADIEMALACQESTSNENLELVDDYRLQAGRILWRLKVALRLKPSEDCSG